MAAVVAEGEQWLLPLEGGPRRPALVSGRPGGSFPSVPSESQGPAERGEPWALSRATADPQVEGGREAAGARWTGLGHRLRVESWKSRG